MRKPRILLVLLSLVLPVLLLGCEGDTGPQGAQGPEGPPGPPGTTTVVLANETCVLCHGEGKIVDVDVIHEEETEELKENSQITISNLDMSFTPNADNVTVTVTFTSTGADLTTINTSRPNPDRLAWLRLQFALLDTRPEDGTTYWYSYTGSQRNPENLSKVGDDYTYEFDIPVSGFDNVNVSLAKFSDNTRHRVAVIIYTGNSSQPLPGGVSINEFADVTGDGQPPAVSRDIVRTENCEECHNRLGAAPYKFVLVDEDIPGVYGEPEAFHGGARYRTEICVTCHDVDFRNGVGTFEVLIHKIHAFEGEEYILSEPFIFGEGDYSKLSFPQDARNCTKCHRGGADSANWNSVPTMAACGACHDDVNFATGENHVGGTQTTNANCALSFCHGPGSSFEPQLVMRTENVTPNNPLLPEGLSRFEYFLDNVAVDNTGVVTVGFRITQDNVLLDLSTGTWPPPSNTSTQIADTNGPTFLLAWALTQDGIDTPAEYNNLNSPDPPSSTNGNGAGDAPSVSLKSLVTDNLVTASGAGYTVTLANSEWTQGDGFPSGATMRAVALQSYFSQVTSTGNVGRHTPSVVLDVDPDDARRQVVKSGYTGDPAAGGQPFGCLECHETLELHGGSRVNNVRVCVFCHNPNKSSSGRTADTADPSCSDAGRSNPCEPEVDPFLVLDPDPLKWPEATNNFKNMIHGIHAATDRPYEFVRNRLNGIYYNWSFVTFPGILSDCEKCHIDESYVPSNVPANTLWNVERITTGDPDETREDIIAARGSVPNPTDLVDSPIAGACFYCHDSGLAKSHILTQGGKLSIWPSIDTGSGATTRSDASVLP